MKVTYEYDQDPRYGWASIDLEESTRELVVMHSLTGGTRGYHYDGETFTPTCICSAYFPSECGCVGVDWGDPEDYYDD